MGVQLIVETLGVTWGTGNIIYDYLSGGAWWAYLIDAGFLVAGIVSGGTAALIKQAVQIGLKQAIRGLAKREAIQL
ncbi:hypothetical protein P5808_29830 [Bacillus cereus]|uniref:hypothetical protein n=1 Tax=Bacillus cereus group TaxID=86661 RepID=UPI000BFCE995|nr:MULTISPECIES: hypothetical protein [Bacillus cereus group]MDF9507853.1 hypothetical protein [Bacillus cereus]MDF9598099.1 hypothetical protein [Bacillus cereus]MDF9610309.1 hypothetical protein [Bacillus cereus]MDF9661231.1 hypothetical protein [Bacillus cereus]MEB4819320.1 hypothetical protein [Bacillus thuringiensis]